MKTSKKDWSQLRSTLILLLFFAFCLYLPSLFFEGFADDDVYLAFSNHVLRESQWSELYKFFLRPTNPLEFLPLRDLSYWLDFRLFGDELNGFHVTNLLWYAASSAASFWLFRELILLCQPGWGEKAIVLSLCGAVIFVVHPAHVEVVAWIASRKDLLAGTLGLLSAALLVRAMRRLLPLREIVAAALLLFAACFGKAAAMTGIVFVTVLMVSGRNCSVSAERAKITVALLLYWALMGVAFIIHLKVGESTGIRIENHPGFFMTVDRASRIFTSLIGILLVPHPLRFYYDVYQVEAWHWLVTASAALLFIASLRVLSKRLALWPLGIVLMLSPLLVYLQLIPFTTWSLASERFVFVSVAGLALMLIDLLGRLKSPTMVAGLTFLVVLPCSAAVWNRIADWEGPPNLLLFREYKLQPTFHNAIRDRIVFKLLPEKRYAEAANLARQLQRRYAVDGLLALIAAEEAYMQVRDAKKQVSANDTTALSQKFCSTAAQLRSATRAAYGHMPLEPDVSYNNILRTLDQQIKFRYGDAKVMCPA